MSSIIVTACDTNDIELLRLVLAGECQEYVDEVKVEDLNVGLIRTSIHGFKECAEVLVDAGADLDYIDEDGEFPLSMAVRNNHVELVEYFLTKTMDLNKLNGESFAPLHIAAINGCTDIAKMLLAAGADKSVRGYEHDSPFLYAVIYCHVELVKLFLREGCDVNEMTPALERLIHFATEKDNYEICRLLVEAGADVNVANVFDFTPLHRAVLQKSMEIVKLLINAGADINAFGHETVLHIACREGFLEGVDFILKDEKFIGIDVTDYHGLTALAKAIHSDNFPVVKRLIKDGASAKCKFINHPGHGMRHQSLLFEDDSPHLIAACLVERRFEIANMLLLTGQYTFQEIRNQINLIQPDQLTEEIKNWIKEFFKPWPLLYMCRAAVNGALWDHVTWKSATELPKPLLPMAEQRKHNIKALPLPNEMKNFLLFSDIE